MTLTIRFILALLIALAVAVIVGHFYVPWLRKIKAGQQILEDGPNWHQSKAGTPTMGGVIFIAGLAAAVLIPGFSCIRDGDLGGVYVLVFSLVYGFIGFLDDWAKLRKKQNKGLSAKAKMALQIVAAVILIVFLHLNGYLQPKLYIPFWNITVNTPVWLYYVLAVFIMVGTVNSVNLTDGLDGLAASVTLPVFIFFTTAAAMWAKPSLGIFSAGLTGSLFGFLVYNFYPAKCFMGDTGSLFLGGAVCGMAYALDMPLILIPLGIIYIIEALSDIIQVSYFKLTHGKRVFKMAPIHHHLEMGGFTGHKWTEKQIVAMFTAIGLAFAVIAFLGCMNRVF